MNKFIHIDYYSRFAIRIPACRGCLFDQVSTSQNHSINQLVLSAAWLWWIAFLGLGEKLASTTVHNLSK